MHQTNGTGPLWPLSKPTQIKTVNIVAGLSCIIVGLILLSGAITISMFSHWGITETLIVSLTIIIVTVTMMIGFAGKSWRNVGITSTITVFLAIIVLTSFQSISLLQITSVFLEILVGFEISTSFFDKQWEEKLKVMVWALFVSLVLIALTWAIALHWHTLTLFSNALVLVLLAIIFVMAVLGVFAYRNLNSQLVRLRYGSAPTLNSVTEAELNAAIEKAFMAAMKDIAERDSETGEALDKIAKYATNTHALLNNLTERYVASSKKSEV